MILFACISAIFLFFFFLKTTTSLRGDTDTDDTHAFLSIKKGRLHSFRRMFLFTALSLSPGVLPLHGISLLVLLVGQTNRTPWSLLSA